MLESRDIFGRGNKGILHKLRGLSLQIKLSTIQNWIPTNLKDQIPLIQKSKTNQIPIKGRFGLMSDFD